MKNLVKLILQSLSLQERLIVCVAFPNSLLSRDAQHEDLVRGLVLESRVYKSGWFNPWF
jgi:hypothetical protein